MNDDDADFYDIKKGQISFGIRSFNTSIGSVNKPSFRTREKKPRRPKSTKQSSSEPLPPIFYERFHIRTSPHQTALHLDCKACSFRYTTNHSETKTMCSNSRKFALNHQCGSERWKGWK